MSCSYRCFTVKDNWWSSSQVSNERVSWGSWVTDMGRVFHCWVQYVETGQDQMIVLSEFVDWMGTDLRKVRMLADYRGCPCQVLSGLNKCQEMLKLAVLVSFGQRYPSRKRFGGGIVFSLVMALLHQTLRISGFTQCNNVIPRSSSYLSNCEPYLHVFPK